MMHNDPQAKVRTFMDAMKAKRGTLAKNPDGTLVHADIAELCARLIEEEAKETAAAIRAGDLPETVDGICDTIYVSYYAMNALLQDPVVPHLNVDLTPFFDAVQTANMAKLNGPKDPETGKQLKPEGWTPPPIAEMLAQRGLMPRPPKASKTKATKA